MRPTIELSQEMTPECVYADFESWLDYVANNIGRRCGFSVDVLVTQGPDDILTGVDPAGARNVWAAYHSMRDSYRAMNRDDS